MTLFNIPLNAWIDFIAALAAIAALICFAIANRQKEMQTAPYTVSLVLVAITAGLLVISIFFGVSRETRAQARSDVTVNLDTGNTKNDSAAAAIID